jgi:predicted nucleotidyltransferase
VTAEDAAVLRKLRAALEAAYGERLREVLLFGSRARGDHRPDSDFDVAVILDPFDDFWAESRRLRAIARDALDLETASRVAALPFAAPDLGRRTLFMHELRREGVAI